MLGLETQVYAETRSALVEGQKDTQEILILQGGFAALQAAYKVCYQTVLP
jgi:hypothetical protein